MATTTTATKTDADLSVEVLLQNVYQDFKACRRPHHYIYIFLRRRVTQLFLFCPPAHTMWLIKFVTQREGLLRLVDTLAVLHLFREAVYGPGDASTLPSAVPLPLFTIQKRVAAQLEAMYVKRDTLPPYVVSPKIARLEGVGWAHVMDLLRRRLALQTFARLLQQEDTVWCPADASSSVPPPRQQSRPTAVEQTRDRLARDRLFSHHVNAVFFGGSRTQDQWCDAEFLGMLGGAASVSSLRRE